MVQSLQMPAGLSQILGGSPEGQVLQMVMQLAGGLQNSGVMSGGDKFLDQNNVTGAMADVSAGYAFDTAAPSISQGVEFLGH